MNEVTIDSLIDWACQNGYSSEEIIKIVRSHKIGKFKLSGQTESESLTGLMVLVMRTGKYKCLLSVIEEYLKKYPEEIDMKCTKGWTALIMAARNSRNYSSIETVTILLYYGANVNAVDNYGWTALMAAVKNSCFDSSMETIEILLEHGANINFVSSSGLTSLIIAAVYSDNTSNIDTIKLLLDRGADINAITKDDDNILMAVINHNTNYKIKTIKFLLDHGTNINWTKNGRSPLASALAIMSNFHSWNELVELLLEHGADINMVDNQGNSIFMKNISYFHDLIPFLLKYKPNLDLVNKDGKTICGMIDDPKVMRILMQYSHDQYTNEIKSDYEKEIAELKHRIKFLEDTIELHPDNEEAARLSESFYQKAK